jgi:trimethylamine:corrinoid methyltransferase-like protein
MNIRTRQRRVARAVWEAGGRLEEVAERERVRLRTLRRWLAEPEFRAILVEEAMEPVLQASSAVMRWAPAAVARLIRDLDSRSAKSAQQAAREILRLAQAAPQQLGPEGIVQAATAPPAAAPRSLADDPLTRSVAALTDDEVERIFGILSSAGEENKTERGSAFAKACPTGRRASADKTQESERRTDGKRQRREGGGR